MGCGAAPIYSRTGSEAGGGRGTDGPPGNEPGGRAGAIGSEGGPAGTAGMSGPSVGGAPAATGGAATGGVSQTGGGPGTASGGANAVSGGASGKGSGGVGAGAAGAGGMGSGGHGSGGQATGGQATGGSGTGGQGTAGSGGGLPGTGGAGSGGRATGGQGGAGGQGIGGAAPTRLIVSIDFVGGRTKAAAAMADTEVAGARRASHWNSASGAMGSLSNLTLSDGTTSVAKITWNAPSMSADPGTWTIGYADAPGDVRMMNGYLDPTWSAVPSAATTILTISGLPAAIASGTYDVYVYTLANLDGDTRSYQYGIGNTVQTVTQDMEPAAPASPYPYVLANDSMRGTHVMFERVTGASIGVTAKPVSSTVSRFRAPINGIQIVWPSGS